MLKFPFQRLNTGSLQAAITLDLEFAPAPCNRGVWTNIATRDHIDGAVFRVPDS